MLEQNNPSNIDINELKIELTMRKSGKCKATITLRYKNMEIKGFRITDSNFENSRGQNLWFQVPSYKTGAGWRPMFWLDDPEEWKKVEEKVWDIYEEKKKDYEQESPIEKNLEQVEEAENEMSPMSIEDIPF